jgi:chloramphenicol O-acetyltransferase type A
VKTIDLEKWPRASQFRFFRGVANPHFALTAMLDATRLMAVDRPAGVSVFNAALYAIMSAANAVPELRTRFDRDQVREYETVHASVTVPIEGERFAFCDIPYAPCWQTCDGNCRREVERAKRQDALRDDVAGQEDWIYLTCLPWLAFTAMTHPVDGPEDCIPRIGWGKIAPDGERWRMPVAVQVHHALVDGLHVGRFFQTLEARLERPLAEGGRAP